MTTNADRQPVPDHEELRQVARAAAADVAREVIARNAEGRPDSVAVQRKGAGDFVTEVDLWAESALRERLLTRYPDHGFLGEESEPSRLDSPFLWVVDPIDGTSNFAQGLPLFGVSVACLSAGVPVAGAVHAFPEDVTYSAARGAGAFRSDQRIHTPAAALDDASVIGVQWLRGEYDPAFLQPLLECGARIRVFGSTVVQLCDVAVGRLHANVQKQGRLWDFAAAALIVEEAGGRFSGLGGEPVFPIDPRAERHFPSLAAPAPMHGALLAALRA